MRRTRTGLFALTVLFGASVSQCGSGEEEIFPSDTEETTHVEADDEEIVDDVVAPDVPDDEPEEIDHDDLYEGHHLWCEWINPPRCGKSRERNPQTRRMEWVDYGSCGTDHRGEDLRCVNPYWAEEDYRICVPKFPKKDEQDWRRMRLRYIIGRSFDLDGEWWKRVATDHQAARAWRVYRYFRAVVVRETSMRPFKIHNLNPDVEAARSAYDRFRSKGTYEGNPHFDGYRVIGGPGEREGMMAFEEVVIAEKWGDAKEIEEQIQADHPDWITFIQSNSSRWVSYGYTGQQSAGWIFEVDPMAPPEALCLETFAVETYLRRMRRMAKKLDRKYDCLDKNGKPYERKLLISGRQKRDRKTDTFRPSTWHVIHRAASSGKACPRHSDSYLETKIGFERRARGQGLDPHQHVTSKMLGRDLSPKELMAVEEEMDEIFCETFDQWLHKSEYGVCG